MAVTGQSFEAESDLTQLEDHPSNPRHGSDTAVATSIDRNGWYGAIIAQRSSRRILAGHTRRRVLVDAGNTTGPVLWIDCDDDTALRILLADNRTAELAIWNDDELLDALHEVSPDELAAAGFTLNDVETLERAAQAAAAGEVDAAAEWAQAGMPAYDSDDLMHSAYRTVVHFRNDDDAEAFFRMLNRPRARYLWWPEVDGHIGMDITQNVVAEAVP